MRKLLTITLGIFLISCIFAIEINAGENYSFDLDKPYVYYEISNYSEYVNISQNGTIVLIEVSKYIPSSNLTITFYDEKDEIVETLSFTNITNIITNNNFNFYLTLSISFLGGISLISIGIYLFRKKKPKSP